MAGIGPSPIRCGGSLFQPKYRVPLLFLFWELKKFKIILLEQWQFYKVEINSFKHNNVYPNPTSDPENVLGSI